MFLQLWSFCCSPRGPFFFLFFVLSSLSKFIIAFLHQPLLRKPYCFFVFLLCRSFLFPLSFLHFFASYLETNFPAIPFSDPCCFHFWLVGSAVVVLFLFDCLCLRCLLVFCYERHCFPCFVVSKVVLFKSVFAFPSCCVVCFRLFQ